MNREQRIKIAEETLEILRQGEYNNAKGQKVIIKEALVAAEKNSKLFYPEELNLILHKVTSIKKFQTNIEVTGETALQAANRLFNSGENILCLNFASAKNPGGGFLSGSQAQEESLARSSGLYPCIAQMKEMYDINSRTRTCLYTDHMIYSPNVPVFRNDNGELLDDYHTCSFITAPAVNAGIVKEREKENIPKIREVMMRRIQMILSLAMKYNHEVLILGAWGCGVFRNDPADIAEYFRYFLIGDPQFNSSFRRVVFAVYDSSKEKAVYSQFANKLKPLTPTL